MIQFETGRAGISGMVRGADETGHDTFAVHLPNLPPLYGEWKPRWAENQNDFDVEIVRFGYPDKLNVDNPHPGARRRLSDDEQKAVQRLVIALFSDPEAQRGNVPFSSKLARFLGGIHFFPGWSTKK